MHTRDSQKSMGNRPKGAPTRDLGDRNEVPKACWNRTDETVKHKGQYLKPNKLLEGEPV